MRVALITAGAAGMYCGSCLRDNALVTALRALGHDALLVPTYTPIRTDEEDVSQGRVFFGGVSVYLEQQSRLFRHLPRPVNWLLSRPALLRWAGRFAETTDYSKLGGMTASVLRGEDGHQRREIEPLITFLRDEAKPEVVLLTNALISGIVPRLRADLGVPVVTTLQGDDIFLDALPLADRAECVRLIRSHDAQTAGYLCTSRYYADQMATYLGLPREKMHIVWPGINLKGHGEGGRSENAVPVVGFFARICPEKGLHNIVDAFVRLRRTPGAPAAKLRVGGWLGEGQKPYLAAQVKKLESAGLLGDFERVDCPSHAEKVAFLRSLDLLSVPTDYREPKGLYVLEAWANGVPVVQPAHGAFPELLEATGGGLLCEPGNTADLAAKLGELLADPARRKTMGDRARAAVAEQFSARRMAETTAALLDQLRAAPAGSPHADAV